MKTNEYKVFLYNTNKINNLSIRAIDATLSITITPGGVDLDKMVTKEYSTFIRTETPPPGADHGYLNFTHKWDPNKYYQCVSEDGDERGGELYILQSYRTGASVSYAGHVLGEVLPLCREAVGIIHS